MKNVRQFPFLLALCSLLVGGAAVNAHRAPASAGVPAADDLSADTNKELARVRNATAKYRDVARAEADGYFNEGYAPGEGFEHVNQALIDCTFDAEHPEVLLYVQQGGRLRLAGVEYVVPTGCTPAPPEGFAGDADVWEENAEGFPVWALRAWLWLRNPDGMFAATNPRVP